MAVVVELRTSRARKGASLGRQRFCPLVVGAAGPYRKVVGAVQDAWLPHDVDDTVLLHVGGIIALRALLWCERSRRVPDEQFCFGNDFQR